MTLFAELFEERLSVYRDAPFLIVDGRPVSYSDLLEQTRYVAVGLRAHGVEPGSRVSIMMDTSERSVITWFAAAALGTVEVPINTHYKGNLLAHIIADSDVETLVCDAKYLPVIREILPQTSLRLIFVSGEVGELDAIAGVDIHPYEDLLAGEARPFEQGGDTGSVILYTSGTTGISKGVVHSPLNCIDLAHFVAEVNEYSPEDVLFNFFPLYHQNARYTAVLAALVSGARIRLDSQFSSSAFWDICRTEGITAFNYLGSVLAMILNASRHLSPEEARNHRVTRAWGAGATPDVWAEFEERFGVGINEVYGLSEAPMATFNSSQDRVSPIGSAGRETRWFEVRIVDEEDRILPPGEPGEIVLRPKGPTGFMLGYHGRDADTVLATRNLWFHSGDRGYLSADGDLFFLDRAKDAIRRRGVNISAWEVESAFASAPGVTGAAAYGVPSELPGDEEIMVALATGEGFDLVRVLDEASRHLPDYAMPRYVRLVGQLPMTDTLKIQKRVLRDAGITLDTIDLNTWPDG